MGKLNFCGYFILRFHPPGKFDYKFDAREKYVFYSTVHPTVTVLK